MVFGIDIWEVLMEFWFVCSCNGAGGYGAEAVWLFHCSHTELRGVPLLLHKSLHTSLHTVHL